MSLVFCDCKFLNSSHFYFNSTVSDFILHVCCVLNIFSLTFVILSVAFQNFSSKIKIKCIYSILFVERKTV